MGIARTVVVAQGKGGVGKTSTASNVAGLAAEAGLRACIIDLDPQGNVARDLGLAPDDGNALFTALITGASLPVTRDVRPRLDVVMGGPAVADITGVMFSRSARGGEELASTFHRSLSAIADEYDLILIDTPPNEKILVEAAFAVAAAVVIPTRADDASLDGLGRVAERFIAARTTNPDLRLAGVLLFAIGARSKRLEDGARETIAAILGDSAPVFEARVRHLESAAVDARRAGLLAHELDIAALQDRRNRLAALRAGHSPTSGLLVRNAGGLADDYEAVTRELLTRLGQIEQETEVPA
ncbi:MAG: AAA family ATPase [Cellulomonadaceae bacterium]|nr:AAA family ATPase [Cellulomonadaceae bacterium]